MPMSPSPQCILMCAMRGEVQVDSTDGILLEPVLMDLTASQSTALSRARSSPLLRKCASLGRSPVPVREQAAWPLQVHDYSQILRQVDSVQMAWLLLGGRIGLAQSRC